MNGLMGNDQKRQFTIKGIQKNLFKRKCDKMHNVYISYIT